MSCMQTIQDYAFRSIGYGERLLPKTEITLCEQFTLIGSGMIWNIYFAVCALFLGFMFAISLAVARASPNPYLSKPAEWFVFLFRSSPLFIQFFLAYEAFVLLPKLGFEFDLGFVTIAAETAWLTKAWLGALIVLFLNTSAYSAKIFYGGYRSVPRGDLEAASAIGMTSSNQFWRIIWPNMLRISWPAYTNEAIFLFHATTLSFFAGFPAWRQQGDALYYAKYFFDKTFNPFVPYPIVAFYFIGATLLIIFIFSLINERLNFHLKPQDRPAFKYRPQLIR